MNSEHFFKNCDVLIKNIGNTITNSEDTPDITKILNVYNEEIDHIYEYYEQYYNLMNGYYIKNNDLPTNTLIMNKLLEIIKFFDENLVKILKETYKPPEDLESKYRYIEHGQIYIKFNIMIHFGHKIEIC